MPEHRAARAIPFLALALIGPGASAEKLDFARLHADPPLLGTVPRGIEVAPDGARVTFLRPREDDQEVQDLWQIERGGDAPALLLRQQDLLDGPVELTAEEQAERERLRIRARGITSYGYDDTGRRLLIPLAGGLYIHDFDTAEVTAIDDGEARLNPKLAPDGRLHLATDWQDYAEQMWDVLDAEPRLRNRAGPRGHVPRPEWRPQTHFEARGLKLGHGVRDLVYDKIDDKIRDKPAAP